MVFDLGCVATAQSSRAPDWLGALAHWGSSAMMTLAKLLLSTKAGSSHGSLMGLTEGVAELGIDVLGNHWSLSNWGQSRIFWASCYRTQANCLGSMTSA